MLKIILIILTLVPQTILSSESGELQIFDELESLRENRIDQIIQARKSSKKRRYTESELFTLKITLKDITKSNLETAFVKKGSRLISLNDGTTKYTPKRLTVKAYSQADKEGYRYITNKKGSPKYMVSVDNITNITEITDLYREPKKFTRLQKRIPKASYDGEFKYNLLFNFHAGISLTQFTKSIIKDAQDYAPLIRLEVGSNSSFDLPIDTGLSLVYEQISGNLESGAGSFSTRALSLGPNFQKNNLIGRYNLVLQTRIALLSDLTERRSGETTVHSLSDTSLLLALERDFNINKVGNFKFGYSIQRKWLKPSAKSSGLDLSTNAKADDSFGFYIGHGTDLLW